MVVDRNHPTLSTAMATISDTGARGLPWPPRPGSGLPPAPGSQPTREPGGLFIQPSYPEAPAFKPRLTASVPSLVSPTTSMSRAESTGTRKPVFQGAALLGAVR
jgi:hypothetical protein